MTVAEQGCSRRGGLLSLRTMDGRSFSVPLSDAELIAMFGDPLVAKRFPLVLPFAQAADLIQVPAETIRSWRSSGMLDQCSKKLGKHVRTLFLIDVSIDAAVLIQPEQWPHHVVSAGSYNSQVFGSVEAFTAETHFLVLARGNRASDLRDPDSIRISSASPRALLGKTDKHSAHFASAASR
jgi:hypothetical protein